MNTMSTQVSPLRAERVRVCLKKTNSPNPCNRLSREALACWYAASRLHFIPGFSSRGGLQIPRSNTPSPATNVIFSPPDMHPTFLFFSAIHSLVLLHNSSSHKHIASECMVHASAETPNAFSLSCIAAKPYMPCTALL